MDDHMHHMPRHHPDDQPGATPGASAHPADEVLHDHAEGRLRGGQAREVAAHVAGCAACGELVAAAQSGASTLAAAAAARPGTAPVAMPAEAVARLHAAVAREYDLRLAPGVRRRAGAGAGRRRFGWAARLGAAAVVLAAVSVGVVATQQHGGGTSGTNFDTTATTVGSQAQDTASAPAPGAAKATEVAPSAAAAGASAGTASTAPPAAGAAAGGAADVGSGGTTGGGAVPPATAGGTVQAVAPEVPARSGDVVAGAETAVPASADDATCRSLLPTFPATGLLDRLSDLGRYVTCLDAGRPAIAGTLHDTSRPSSLVPEPPVVPGAGR